MRISVIGCGYLGAVHAAAMWAGTLDEAQMRAVPDIASDPSREFLSGMATFDDGRILRKIAEGETENLGDTTTLLDPGVVDEIKNGHL